MKNKLHNLKRLVERASKHNVFKVFYVLLLLSGVVTGVVLVQQEQDLRENAQTNCRSNTTRDSCNAVASCSWYICQLSPNNAACATTGTETSDVCCPGGSTYCSENLTGACQENQKVLWTCASNGTGYINSGCVNPSQCHSSTYPDNGTCDSNDSDETCRNKTIGASCGTGVCAGVSTKANGKWICECSSCGHVNESCVFRPCCSGLECDDNNICKSSSNSPPPGGGGGGGGGTTPTTPPGGGGGGGGGSQCNIDYQENPSTFSGFSSAGELILYVDPGGYEFNIALKKNATTCSQSDNDVLLDTTDAVDNKIDTGLSVSQGDSVCIYPVGYEGTPGGGWIEPNGNICQGPNGAPKDISSLLAKAPQAVSVQCWGDVEVEDCDFNDFAFVFAVENGISGETQGITFKIRFQGITQKAASIIASAKLLLGGNESASLSSETIDNDETGVYSLTFPDTIANGTYDLLFKGNSHLQKKISGISVSGTTEIDLSEEESKQARAGDVTGDNLISLDDIARVSKYYTALRVDVDVNNSEMKSADINKDGSITIQDLALIAINWSELAVKGNE